MIFFRCALVWALATTAAAVAARWLLTAGGSGFEGLLLRTCSLALAACIAWAWLATSAVVLDALRRRQRARRGVPAGLRRLVLAGCGVALVAGASPALATPGPVPLTATPVVVVPATAAPATVAPRVVVRPGDSLWAIAARHLPAGASDRQVADQWHRIYATNRAVIGDDPDVLHPGQRLEIPR
jgi:hypothetical protein